MTSDRVDDLYLMSYDFIMPNSESNTRSTSETCCFIVHAVQPYKYDAMQILTVPEGFEYRLRYDVQWVDPALRSNIEGLEEKQALVIFCDDSKNRFVPFRWARITTAHKVGSFFYFELELGALCKYESELQACEAQVQAFNDTFIAFHPDKLVEKEGKKILELCVLMSKVGQHVAAVPFEEVTNWGNVVSVIGKAKVFEMAEFLKVLDLKDGSGRIVKPRKGGFALSEGKTYSLRILQIVPAKPEASKWDPHDIELRAFSEQIKILRAHQRAVGKYDVLTYVIKVASLSAEERTAMELSSIPVNPGQVMLSSVYVPITIMAPSIPAKLVRATGVILSLAVTFVPMVWTNPLTGSVWEKILPFVGILGFTISLVGWHRLQEAIGLARGKK